MKDIGISDKIIKPGIILLGFIALVNQVIVLREFLTLFSGNELVIGIILANWMLLTGLGAYVGRFFKSDNKRLFWILILLGLLSFIPILSVLAMHIVWYKIFLPGVMAGIIHVFYYSLIILSPFCILAGVLFTLIAKETSLINQSNKIGDVYAWESIGSLIGGLVLNLILIWLFSTFQILFLILLLLISFIIYSCLRLKYYLISSVFAILTFILVFLFLKVEPDKLIRQVAFPGQEIHYSKDSPFGVFVVTEQNMQTNFYENRVLISSSGDVASKEESVHLAMAQHNNPKNILVLSGIISGIIDEIYKYPVKSVDYVDINPEIIHLAHEYFNAGSYNSLNLIERDVFRFLKNSSKEYDVVLINLPKPSTIQLNRYYTQEFFKLLKSCLASDAVISLSLPSSANYMSDESKRFLSIIYATVNSEFKSVKILPLSEDFIITSDIELSKNICRKLKDKDIQTEYLNEFYVDEELLDLRSTDLLKQIDINAPINKDFTPIFYQSQIKMWMNRFNIQYWMPAIFIMIFSGVFFFKTNYVYKGVFAAGFAGTSIEIILMLIFQLKFGYVYVMAGVFIMIFMGGLALGAYYSSKLFGNKEGDLFRRLQLGIVLFSVLLPIFFLLIKDTFIPNVMLLVIFIFLVLIISILTGAIFSLASSFTKTDYAKLASNTYGLDLLGAATGALLFSIYIIPMVGFIWSFLVIALFNLLVTRFR